MTTNEKALLMHEKWNGKLETVSKTPVKTREDLAIAYTPGVAEPCKVIAKDKEAAYKEVWRVLKPGGTFCGCFYVAGECKRTDWFVRHIYEKTGFFTPPYETVSSLKARLEGMYTDVDRGNLKSMAWFVCRKAE